MSGLLLLLVILVGSYGVLWLTARAHHLPPPRMGQVSVGVLLLFTGMAHFILAEAMMDMVPPFIPFRMAIVYLSGLFEILIGILVMRGFRPRYVGWVIIGFLILVFPINIYAAYARIDFGGHGVGLRYLWTRTPLQLIFIVWTWWFCIRPYSSGGVSSTSAKLRR